MVDRRKVYQAQAETLLTIMAYSNKSGRIIARLIKPELFSGDLREVAERLKEYWFKYDSAPRNDLDQMFADILEDPNNRRAGTFKRVLKNMGGLWRDGVNTKYAIDSLQAYERVVRAKDAILKAAETLNAKNELGLEEAEKLLTDMLAARQVEFNKGTTLRDVDKVIDFIEQHYSEFRIGVGPLDRKNIVPSRGAVFLLLASTGVGKSWGLAHIGAEAVKQRKKVAHITLEMGEEETMQRYFMRIYSASKHVHETDVTTFEIDDRTGRLLSVGKLVTVEPSFRFAQANIRSVLKGENAKWDKAVKRNRLPDRLVVRQFPPRQLSINDLRAYLDMLEATGFVPDMLILDYIGIMRTEAANHRITLGRVMEEFRAICIERNIAGVTAHQASRAGAKASLVRPTHVAEDWSLIGTTDVAVTFSQTKAEKAVGLARLLVAKARSAPDGMAVVITQSYDLGQWCLEAVELFGKSARKYWEFHKGLPKDPGDEDDEEDEGEDK